MTVDPNLDHRGACRADDVDPEIFFPFGTGPLAKAQTQQARKVCGRCPLETACLKWAVDTNQPHAIYGGRTEGERKKYGTGPLPARPGAAKAAEPQPRRARGPYKPTCACGLPKIKSRNGGRDRWICPPCDAAKSRRWRSSRERVTA